MYLFLKIFEVSLSTLTISSNPYLSIFPLYHHPKSIRKVTLSDNFRKDESATLEKIGKIRKISLTAIFIEPFITINILFTQCY